jgi:hypothetical protein
VQVKNVIGEIFEEIANGLETGSFGSKVRIGVTILGSELGKEEILKGAENAQNGNSDIEVVVIGNGVETTLELVEAKDEGEAHRIMDEMLTNGNLHGAVTMHYSFPIGVSTVGRVVTPGRGKEMFLATTTGTSDTNRVTGMLKNTLYGIAVAKAHGIENPTVGILNIDGARQVERSLKELQDRGFDINFAQSARRDGGVIMRGNDLLLGVPDIMVTDSLTGNVLMKLFSAYTSGGNYESLGYGYGPGIGEEYDRIICILSRASGAPVVANAIRYAADMAKGNVLAKANEQFANAKKSGWQEIISHLTESKKVEEADEIKPPAPKTVTEEIPGIEILELDNAAKLLWKNNIYATTGMGCTGPIIQVAEEDKDAAVKLLKENKYI